MSEVMKLESYKNLTREQQLAYAQCYRNGVSPINRTAWLQKMGISRQRMKGWLEILDNETKVPVPPAANTWEELTTPKIKIEQIPSWVTALMKWPADKLIPDEGIPIYEVFQRINMKVIDGQKVTRENREEDAGERANLEKINKELHDKIALLVKGLKDADLENSRLEVEYRKQINKTQSALMVVRMLAGGA